MAEKPEERAPPPRCNTCTFYDTSILAQPGYGYCRGVPPIPPASIGQPSHWPVVGNFDWCKQYLANSATWP